MERFFIKTFGCQMNMHDSEKAAGILQSEGYREAENYRDADLILLNTCSIRHKAEQKFLSELGRLKGLKKRNGKLRIAVMGCIAKQMAGELFKRAPHVDFVIGPENIHLIGEMVKTDRGAIEVGENPDIAETELPVSRRERGRAWVSIMYGCNNFCSYCIVPYTRGRERSRPSENILREIEGLSSEGFKEVTLLGQNVNSYRGDVDFTGLLGLINRVEKIKRIRFVTSHPRDFSDSLIEAMRRLDKLCEHIHLPLQSGSDRMLRLMNRGYTFNEYRGKIEKLRLAVPNVSITSDIISGFPEETEKDHKDTINALKELCFDGIFSFKFSPRPGTNASGMKGQIPDSIKSERLTEIQTLQDDITFNKNKCLEGEIQEILVEDSLSGHLTGRTRTNKIVNFEGPESLINEIISVRIKRAGKHSMLGELSL